jgi:hypothetical protein
MLLPIESHLVMNTFLVMKNTESANTLLMIITSLPDDQALFIHQNEVSEIYIFIAPCVRK